MSHRYLKKRKSQLAYIIHKDGKRKKVTKSFKPGALGSLNYSDQKGEIKTNIDQDVDVVQVPVLEENAVDLTPEVAPSCAQKKYEKAKYKRLENWAEVSKKLYQKGLQKQYLTVSTCSQSV